VVFAENVFGWRQPDILPIIVDGLSL